MLCSNCFRELNTEGACPCCGYENRDQRAKYPMALRPGAILNGRYIVGRVLGQGGFGITYLAQDDQTKERVAIKEYLPTDFAGRGADGASVIVYAGGRQRRAGHGDRERRLRQHLRQ